MSSKLVEWLQNCLQSLFILAFGLFLIQIERTYISWKLGLKSTATVWDWIAIIFMHVIPLFGGIMTIEYSLKRLWKGGEE